MIKFSEKLKARFCKDCNLPIGIFRDPYFFDRIDLFQNIYHAKDKWNIFADELNHYNNEEEYFAEYNRVKNEAINSIKNSQGFVNFSSEDMNKFSVKNQGFCAKNIYHPDNDGNEYISIDMRKANFSSLYYYDPSIFGCCETWEEFIGGFTNNKHIINSKYIRQVILGNCNPKRHITYEKHLMDSVLSEILKSVPAEKIVFFSNDEIVINISDIPISMKIAIYDHCYNVVANSNLPLKLDTFILIKISGVNGYIKRNNSDGLYELKCVDSYYSSMIIRKLIGQEITDSDLTFVYEGCLAKFIEIPEIDLRV